MGRRTGRPPALREVILSPAREACLEGGRFMRVAYTYRRTVVRLDGLWRLGLGGRRCGNSAWGRYPPGEGAGGAGAWGLPQGGVGVGSIAQVWPGGGRERERRPHKHQPRGLRRGG